MPDIFVAKKDSKKKKLSTPKNHHSKKIKYSPLASFMYCPREAKFAGKDSREDIILILRKHPITNVKWILISLVMIFAPVILRVFPIFSFLPESFQFITMVGWYLLVLAFVFEEFLGWFYNVNVVTDERVFDVDFVNLVYREITDNNIDKIQDVTVRMGGFIRTMFNYGDVIIQTAAEIPQIELEGIPNPDRVAKILRELRVEEEQEKIEGRVR